MLQCMTSWANHVMSMYAKSPTSMHFNALFQGTLPSVDDWWTDSFLWCTVPCLFLGAIGIVLILRRFLPMRYVMAICVIVGGCFACFSDHLHLASDYLREIDFADFQLNVSSFHDLFNFAALVDWMEGMRTTCGRMFSTMLQCMTSWADHVLSMYAKSPTSMHPNALFQGTLPSVDDWSTDSFLWCAVPCLCLGAICIVLILQRFLPMRYVMAICVIVGGCFACFSDHLHLATDYLREIDFADFELNVSSFHDNFIHFAALVDWMEGMRTTCGRMFSTMLQCMTSWADHILSMYAKSPTSMHPNALFQGTLPSVDDWSTDSFLRCTVPCLCLGAICIVLILRRFLPMRYVMAICVIVGGCFACFSDHLHLASDYLREIHFADFQLNVSSFHDLFSFAALVDWTEGMRTTCGRMFSTMLQCMISWADHVMSMYAKSPTSMHPNAYFREPYRLWMIGRQTRSCGVRYRVCVWEPAICIVLILRRFLPMRYIVAICVIVGGCFACFSDHLHLASDYLHEIDFADFELNFSSFHDLIHFAALVDWMEGMRTTCGRMFSTMLQCMTSRADHILSMYAKSPTSMHPNALFQGTLPSVDDWSTDSFLWCTVPCLCLGAICIVLILRRFLPMRYVMAICVIVGGCFACLSDHLHLASDYLREIDFADFELNVSSFHDLFNLAAWVDWMEGMRRTCGRMFSTMLQCMTSWVDHVLSMYAKSPTSMHPNALFQGTLPSVDDWSTDSFMWCTVPCLCLGATCIVLILRRFLPMRYVMAICVIVGGCFACFSDHLHLASDYLREIVFADFELNISSFHDLIHFAALVDWMEGMRTTCGRMFSTMLLFMTFFVDHAIGTFSPMLSCMPSLFYHVLNTFPQTLGVICLILVVWHFPSMGFAVVLSVVAGGCFIFFSDLSHLDNLRETDFVDLSDDFPTFVDQPDGVPTTFVERFIVISTLCLCLSCVTAA